MKRRFHAIVRSARWVVPGVIALTAFGYFFVRDRKSGEGKDDPLAGRSGSELELLEVRRFEPPRPGGGSTIATPTAIATTDARLVDEPGNGERLDGGLSAQLALTDPEAGGWMGEKLSDRVGKQLGRLKKALILQSGESAGLIAALLSDDCQGSWLVPDPISRHEKGRIFSTAETEVRALSLSGTAEVAAELQRWGERFDAARIKFKVVRISPGQDEHEQFETIVLANGDGATGGGSARSQESARWRLRWHSPTEGAAPLIREIMLEHAESSDLELGGETLFADRTAAAMAGVRAYPHQYLQGNNHWARVIPQAEGGALLGYNGLAVGDADGDGIDDIYVPDGGALPNRLLIHLADGTLDDRSVVAGVDWLEQTVAALFVDLDNDGDQDLVAAATPFLLFMENDGHGKFTFRGAHHSATNPFSLAAADYDGDRLLDIYLCNYSGSGTNGAGSSGTIGSYPIPYTDAENGVANVLLKNLGGFCFRDVTEETGLDKNNTRFSQAASWEDFDGDGDPDLYVANDFGRNNLYRNDQGPTPGSRLFVDVAAGAGVEDQASGMSVAWGDYDRDGQPDLYVSNMFSSAGNRVTYQKRFLNSRAADEVTATRRMARGNTLFRARGDGRFEDLSEVAGVAMARWAWGSLFADLDNDGWEDLVVANGYLTNDRADDL